MYIKAFEKSTLLAEKRNVPKDQILRNKADIDSYFKGGNAQMKGKKKSKLQSNNKKVNNTQHSNRISKLTLKRNNKIDWYMHNASSYIVNQLVSNNINTLVIGSNKEWKQDTNMGKQNNQNFVSIPFDKLKHQLEYK